MILLPPTLRAQLLLTHLPLHERSTRRTFFWSLGFSLCGDIRDSRPFKTPHPTPLARSPSPFCLRHRFPSGGKKGNEKGEPRICLGFRHCEIRKKCRRKKALLFFAVGSLTLRSTQGDRSSCPLHSSALANSPLPSSTY